MWTGGLTPAPFSFVLCVCGCSYVTIINFINSFYMRFLLLVNFCSCINRNNWTLSGFTQQWVFRKSMRFDFYRCSFDSGSGKWHRFKREHNLQKNKNIKYFTTHQYPKMSCWSHKRNAIKNISCKQNKSQSQLSVFLSQKVVRSMLHQVVLFI